jgi:ATP-binding cassette, subfamily B, bacterial PglK
MSSFNKFLSLLTVSEKGKAKLLVILMTFGMILETLSIGLIVPVVGLLVKQDMLNQYPAIQHLVTLLGNPSPSGLIMFVMLFLVVMYALKNLYLGYMAWQQTHFAYDVQRQLSNRLFDIYLTQPYTFHLQRNSAQLIRNITVETNLLSISINAFLLVIAESLVIIGIASLLFWFEPIGALAVVSILSIAGYGFLRLTKRKIIHWGAQRQHHDGMRIQHLQQSLGCIKDLILLNRQNHFLEQFKLHNQQSIEVTSRQVSLHHIPRLGLEFFAISALACLILVMLYQGKNLSEIVPILGLFAAAAFRLLPSANRMLQSIQTVRFAIPIVNLLHDELKLAQSLSSEQSSYVFNHSGQIKISNLCFSYPDTETLALKNIEATIEKGTTVGLIGASGSGKSTLVDLMMGLLQPISGEISIDGHNIHQNIKSWQSKIGYVPQTIYLMDDTIRRNIAFGVDAAAINEQALADAIKAAQLNDFIENLGVGLDTIVGEHGVKLSGGQRQRIGIARALYHNPEVLILDEATSALDVKTESDVMAAIDALHGQKTIIIITHRMTTVENCDHLYELEAGSIKSVNLTHKKTITLTNGF